MIDALCRMFHNRLYKSSLQDAAAIDIAIRGELPRESYAMSILRIAVRESALHEKEQRYSAKSDTSVKLPTFTLNRRLVPRYSLGLRMQGRVELTAKQIEQAAKQPDDFVSSFLQLENSKRKRTKTDPNQANFLDD
ncbi:hypothetical protein [Sphingopyxis sp. BSNA05]|uniref:ORC-CDC6 family AAA ATPase n=1 Tax=Sphingopyxis sp. BSNA05 TaxID=1236614 RepID=UPI001563AD7B|nr:hypothetical protein [Sphingopyxis sp. BSNA05]